MPSKARGLRMVTHSFNRASGPTSARRASPWTTTKSNAEPMTIAPGGGKQIVILASAADAVAIQLRVRLARPDVVVVTPSDLSRSGWSYRPGRRESTIVVGGETLWSHDIAAVITRLPWISEVELPHIIA